MIDFWGEAMTDAARQALTTFMGAIDAMMPQAAAALPAPPAGATPQQLAEWWRQVSEPDRRRYVTERPELVAGLDGLPAAVRDEANRTLLDRTVADVKRQEQEAWRVPGDAATDRATELAERHRQLTVLRDKLGPDGQDTYLLGFDNAGDGKAIVSRGNPDTAAHVGTFVPGTGAGFHDLPVILDQNSSLFDSANRVPGANTATISWIGYDAPNDPLAASQEHFATDANQALDRFQQGLDTVNPDAHHTLVGHSYGSTVIGYAARDGGLPVDDIVLVGSPGVGVDTAAQLDVPADRVWVVEDNQDRIADLNWFGKDPGDDAFGANQVAAEPEGRRPSNVGEYTDAAHLDYFWNKPETQQSYDNIGDIIAGRPPTHR